MNSTFWIDGYRDAQNGFPCIPPLPFVNGYLSTNVYAQEYVDGYQAAARELPSNPGARINPDCPNALTPDGPICPRCGGRRGESGVDGGSWVHY